MAAEATIDLESVERCDLCGGSSFRKVLETPDLAEGIPGRFSLARCSCGLAFLDPRPKPASIHRVYPATYDYHVDASPSRLAHWQRLAGAAAPPRSWLARLYVHFAQNVAFHRVPGYQGEGRLLDVGCGSGAFLDTMAALGWRTHGVDAVPAAAQSAARKGHTVRVGGADALEFPDASFDLVYMSHVLEHVFSPRRALAEALRVLKPGGSLMLAVPNYGSIQARLFGRYWAALDLPRHLYQFNRPTLERYLREAGFEGLHITTRTGSTSLAKAGRLFVNHLFGAGLRRDPKWLEAVLEIPTFISGLFRYFGAGHNLRVVGRRPQRPRAVAPTAAGWQLAG